MLKKYFVLFFTVITLLSCKKESIKAQEIDAIYNRTIFINSDTIEVFDPYYNIGNYLLKGQLHCHTTNSDGALNPNELANYYDSLGYDFFTITDHNFITKEPENNKLIWLGDSYEHTMWKSFHACIYNTQKKFPYENDLNSTIQKVKAENTESFISYAHPDWVGLYQKDSTIKKIKHLDFVEVSNGNGKNSTFKSRALDSLLSLQNHAFAVAVDDFHKYSQTTNSWVDVLAFAKDKLAIWNALKAGTFFSTNGAKMDMSLDEIGLIRISTPLPSTIKFIGQNGMCLKIETNVTLSEYQIIGNEKYVRCEVEDSNFKLCWSQAIIIKQKLKE